MSTASVDLTVAGSSGQIGGVVFTNEQNRSGTGIFDSFVQIQDSGVEQGYNTDATHQYDENTTHRHNHSILLADVPIVIGDGSNGTIEGIAYREFLFDANEATGGASRLLSLDALQIWQEESGSLNNFTPGAGFAGAHTNYLAYNLDAGGDTWVAINAALSSGSGRSDMRVLIPDSYFIHDAAHRYVTLYSELGLQGGAYGASGGFEEWGLNGASGGARSALVVDKTATVPGGTADTAGEVIDYTITVANVGNTALTGITVTDPNVSNLAPVLSSGFNIGDTNHDGSLSAGETWQYTASHTVTQDDIDGNGGGDGVIENIATIDSAETAPVTASAIIAVAQRPAVELVKTADATSVDAAGDVINYTITVTNTGNTTLTNPVVTDPQATVVTPVVDFNAPVLGPVLLTPVLVGDYNAGDTNQNGVQDPGETFQYTNPGDTNQNGVQDPGETFVYANIGDTNLNGFQDTGETFQYYNAGDTNHNGVEDPGETFQFNVNDTVAGVDADQDGFNDGDLNHDGRLNVGETWTYAESHTVTQAEIDNGGVVDPNLSIDNTATVTTIQDATATDTVSVDIEQNPDLTITKAADVTSVDSAGDVINYTVTVQNTGNMTLTDVSMSDAFAGLTLASGDTNTNGKLDLNETWTYTGSHMVTQAEIDNGGVVDPNLSIDNTATVTTIQATATDTVSVDIEQNPDLTITKAADVTSVDGAGDVINYTVTVQNAGNMTLTGVTVTDPFAALTLAGGDANNNGKLDVAETWTYTGSHTVTADEMTAGGSISNTATADTAQTDPKSASASVTVVQPQPPLTIDDNDLVTQFVDIGPTGPDAGGDLIQFFFKATNHTSNTLTSFSVTDTLGDAVTGSLQNPIPSTLGPLGVFGTTFNHHLTAADVTAGYVDEDVTASGFDPSNALQTATLHFHFLL